MHDVSCPNWTDHDDAVHDAEFFRATRENSRRQNSMVGFSVEFVLKELGCEFIPPCLMILRIEDDEAAVLFPVLDRLMNVGTSRSWSHAYDVIILVFPAECLEKIDLGRFTKLVCRLLLQPPLQFLQFRLH